MDLEQNLGSEHTHTHDKPKIQNNEERHNPHTQTTTEKRLPPEMPNACILAKTPKNNETLSEKHFPNENEKDNEKNPLIDHYTTNLAQL